VADNFSLNPRGKMPQRYTIQAVIYPGDESGYVAECQNLAVVTQGQTLDETVKNLREAVQLHLRGEDLPRQTRPFGST